MARVFVVGAHLPRGGGYMAYHLGRIVACRLGLQPVAVRVGEEHADHGVFDYPELFETLPVGRLLAEASADDVLVCNPYFSARLLGLKFPGRSLMYVQGVNTFQVIDGFFDHYVAVSSFVRDHLALHYGWDVPVIAPFIRTELIAPPTPWAQRPVGSVAVVAKWLGDDLFVELRRLLAERDLDGVLSFTRLQDLTHRDFLDALQVHRYFLQLSPIEGYGLGALEAMRSGCCVVGFHAGGGLDYLRNGVNSAVVGYPRLGAVADLLAELVDAPHRGMAMAGRAAADVGDLTYEAFEDRWRRFLDAAMMR